ncbi:phosphatidylinositol 3-kinase 1, putative [Entamoeba histolytica HM-1:IMSS]|uniref:1-phosphatidylinositol 4-kinase n=1 Tax=Entamoeba histolytica (strain ATCC 30459 / HM-1:IMSS / ABRM) TaxID=294381 RepID=C4LXL6_ENTH1|nr:phosphatidylinositol 3-kinase 1, putative [Entamoeba histolytica HM-1:IMSS]EAL51286.2 phosphatidylinositol 3-kinase 1, putative [Entamoeba histolytica HM-1:IMSS]|eukprot:XP_656672.2 phosphatidylinositol 3-kinase 1, putative [Entamoeba histolytica HM-1:IMSS]
MTYQTIRKTFLIPTKRITQFGRTTYHLNQPQIRLIQTIEGTKYVGVSFSSSYSANKIILEAQKQMLVDEEGEKLFCLYNLPFYFDDQTEVLNRNTNTFYLFCLTYGYSPVYEILNKKYCKEYKPIEVFLQYLKTYQINYEIIGFEYLTVLKSIPEECRDFRSSLARVRQEEFEWATNNFDKKILEENEYVYIESEPPITEFNLDKIRINGRYGTDMSMKTIVHLPSDSIEEVINNLFTKLHTMKPSIFNENAQPSDFVLKVRGFNEFIIPYKRDGSKYCLSDFDYIRKCIHLKLPIDVVLFNRENMHHNLWNENTIKMMKYFDQFVGNNNWNLIQDETRCLSQRECQTPVCIQIISAERIKHYKITKLKDDSEIVNLEEDLKIYITGSLHYGTRLLVRQEFTPVYQIKEGKLHLDSPIMMTFNILISTLPKETRLTLSIYMTDSPINLQVFEINKKDICLATINCKLVDYNGYFMKGLFNVGMWERTEPNPIMMCCENTSSNTCKLHYRMIEFNKPVKMNTFIANEQELNTNITGSVKIDSEHTLRFKYAVEADPLTVLSQEDCRLLWTYRSLVMKTKPRSIARLVSAVDFTQQSEVLELHRLLNKWPLLEPTHALELLDFRFPDEQVRLFALKCLDAMKDYELVNFLPQLVQALKFELHHQSNLAYFLLRRALRNKNIIGHQFFWFLKAEMHDNRVTERYGVLLEAFLNGCEDYRTELYNEVTFQNQLVVIANKVKQLETKEEQKQLLKDSLAKLKYPEEMSLPLDSRFRIKKPIPNTGNVFSSKKKPLMLVLENVDPLGDNIMVIQKVGDGS